MSTQLGGSPDRHRTMAERLPRAVRVRSAAALAGVDALAAAARPAAPRRKPRGRQAFARRRRTPAVGLRQAGSTNIATPLTARVRKGAGSVLRMLITRQHCAPWLSPTSGCRPSRVLTHRFCPREDRVSHRGRAARLRVPRLVRSRPGAGPSFNGGRRSESKSPGRSGGTEKSSSEDRQSAAACSHRGLAYGSVGHCRPAGCSD